MLANTSEAPVPSSVRDLPIFKTMLPEECEAVLSRNNVGRIAFALHDRVNIVPVHYVYANGWVYGRTTSAGKLREILRNRRIAFEVDEVSQLFEWRSVIVRGPLYMIQPDSAQQARSVYRTALSLMRRLIPESLTSADPVPFRDQLFRIRAAEVSGRTSAPIGGEPQPPKEVDDIAETAHPDFDAALMEQVGSAIASLKMPGRSNVHVEAFDGVVVLSGLVETAADRQAIESAVLAVPAVAALVQDLETVFPSRQEPSPAEIARAALAQLLLAPSLVGCGMKVVVEHGWLRLEGAASSQRIWDEVIRRVRRVKGSRGVIDRLHIVDPPTVLPAAD